ncbi:DUF3592 domain-containing protein [Streptomyces sp. NPDC006476]|uniref:DUF3592 domain-containing protein n=1 Tax=Streptomyces sp. NPDC006476 TaxID=3157175 RepID=UPI0033BF64E5
MIALSLALLIPGAGVILLIVRPHLRRDLQKLRAWNSGHAAAGRCLSVDTYETETEEGLLVEHLHLYEFTDASGRQCLFSEWSRRSMTNRKGDSVTVYYEPERPEWATAIPPLIGRKWTILELVTVLVLLAVLVVPIPVLGVACAVSGSACWG